MGIIEPSKRARYDLPAYTHNSELEVKVEVGRVEVLHTPGRHVLSLTAFLGPLEEQITSALKKGLITSISFGYKQPEGNDLEDDAFGPVGPDV